MELTEIARPYANAVFELAKTHNNLAEWQQNLDTLAAIVGNEAFQNKVNDPAFSDDNKQSLIDTLFTAIAGEPLSGQLLNLVKLVIENKRIMAFQQIAVLFARLREQAESTLAATIVTAVTADADTQARFQQALSSKLGQNVDLTYEVDENLLGGAVIRTEDWVVDGSVQGQLNQLMSAVSTS